MYITMPLVGEKARNLILIFNSSGQRPHLNYILISNVYSFEFP